MKQKTDSAVRPRREVLAALAASAITVAGAPKLLEATEPPKKKPAASEDKYAFTILIGRFCVDDKFRDDFFKAKDPKAAMALIEKDHMPMSPVIPQWVTALFAVPKQLAGLKDACKKAEDAANVAREKMPKLPPPCNPWPC